MTGAVVLSVMTSVLAVASLPFAVGQLVAIRRVTLEYRNRIEQLGQGLRSDEYAAVHDDELYLEFDSRPPLRGFPTAEAFEEFGLVRRQICMARLEELADNSRATQTVVTTVSTVLLGVLVAPLGGRIWTTFVGSSGHLLGDSGTYFATIGAMLGLMLLAVTPMVASTFASARRAQAKYWRRAYREAARRTPTES